jgi:hypothetical protein
VTAALNQAKLASQFIGEDERHMEQIKMDAKHMLSGRSGKSQRSKPKVQQQGLSKGMDDKTFMQRQLESARRKENSGLDQFKNIPGEFMALLDIDGDGTVDQEEYALMEELENVTGEDVDGDGMVDDAEHRLAKIRAGRKLLAKRFVDKQGGNMYRYGAQFVDHSNADCTEMICKAKYFASLMNDLKYQERQFRLSSSDQVQQLLKPPLSTRMITGRYCDLSDSMAGNVSYKVPKKLQASRKGITAAQMQQARTRDEVLFSARKHRELSHNHTRGEIKGYGNFTNYVDKTIQIYGSYHLPK